ncbi:MAG TPA: ABC transporter ATP-binding protein [Vicinamibacterales bacterium]|nr:ABC transporter ATP-binding protein [Vicinamibacterales bacterium]
MPEPVVTISRLTRSFGVKKALNDVSLVVPRGCVFGLVGENGAGKSTLLKHILGLWRAETGVVKVFDMDPVADPVAVLARIGYLSEEPDLPGWMRVREVLRYTAAFYPKWDTAYAAQLCEQFALDAGATVKTLSKGQRARLGLIVAEAHRPELLILDEPSSGLDPIVRRDILEAIVRTIADEGRTIIFSSHLLDEVERVSDHLAMLHQGRLRFCAPLDDIKARHRRISLRFDRPLAGAPAVSGAIRVDGGGREWTVICDDTKIHAASMARHLGATVVDDTAASLDEIFIAHAAER